MYWWGYLPFYEGHYLHRDRKIISWVFVCMLESRAYIREVRFVSDALIALFNSASSRTLGDQQYCCGEILISSTYWGAGLRVVLTGREVWIFPPSALRCEEVGLFTFVWPCTTFGAKTEWDASGTGFLASSLASVDWGIALEEDVAAGLPNAGLDAGAAMDSGWANLRSLMCLISNLGSPFLNFPTSNCKVDRDTRLCTLKGPS